MSLLDRGLVLMARAMKHWPWNGDRVLVKKELHVVVP